MINFSKMHSLGNDFMVIDAISDAVTLKPEHIAEWGDRQRGIGFDQLLMVAPPSSPDCDFDYVIFNADGGEAEQCGNGTRCVTDFVHRRGLTQQNQLNWHSNGGIVRTAIRDDGMIETWLPEPEFQHAAVPFLQPDSDESAGQCVALQTERGEFQVVPVSMGNPHGVVFVDDVIGLDVVGIGLNCRTTTRFQSAPTLAFVKLLTKGLFACAFLKGCVRNPCLWQWCQRRSSRGVPHQPTQQQSQSILTGWEASGGMALRQRTDQTRR